MDGRCKWKALRQFGQVDFFPMFIIVFTSMLKGRVVWKLRDKVEPVVRHVMSPTNRPISLSSVTTATFPSHSSDLPIFQSSNLPLQASSALHESQPCMLETTKPCPIVAFILISQTISVRTKKPKCRQLHWNKEKGDVSTSSCCRSQE